jgi:hypothetical protein
MRGVREDRGSMASSAHVPGMRRDALLRQLTEPAREQTRARKRTPGHCIRSAGRTLVILLSRRRVRRILERRQRAPVAPSIMDGYWTRSPTSMNYTAGHTPLASCSGDPASGPGVRSDVSDTGGQWPKLLKVHRERAT